jgi:hypothetical protein
MTMESDGISIPKWAKAVPEMLVKSKTIAALENISSIRLSSFKVGQKKPQRLPGPFHPFSLHGLII